MKINRIKVLKVNGNIYKTEEELLAYYVKESLLKIFAGMDWRVAIDKMTHNDDYKKQVIEILQTSISDLEEK